MFCTEEQTYFRQFHEFCILTKISIEILPPFVYNVFIAVNDTRLDTEEGNSLPERS